MIKINLVGEPRKSAAPALSPFAGLSDGADRSLWFLVGLLMLGVLVGLGHFLMLKNQLQVKQGEVAEAQREVDELAPYIKEVEEFKTKKVELERRVGVINELKGNQKGPVQIMDQVSRAVPPLLWLTRLEVGGSRITASGEAFNTNAVANFIENLDRVPEFQEPILRDTAEQGQVYTFVIEFNYSQQARAESSTELGSGAS